MRVVTGARPVRSGRRDECKVALLALREETGASQK